MEALKGGETPANPGHVAVGYAAAEALPRCAAGAMSKGAVVNLR